MKTLLKKVTVLQPGADPAEPRDILIEDGIITRIAKSISDGTARVVTSPNLYAAPGFVDIGAQPGQPGFEFRETYASLARSAQAGGYTALAIFPRTQPPTSIQASKAAPITAPRSMSARSCSSLNWRSWFTSARQLLWLAHTGP